MFLFISDSYSELITNRNKFIYFVTFNILKFLVFHNLFEVQFLHLKVFDPASKVTICDLRIF